MSPQIQAIGHVFVSQAMSARTGLIRADSLMQSVTNKLQCTIKSLQEPRTLIVKRSNPTISGPGS